MTSNFDWNDLKHFLEVARAGTVSLAARRLRVNHTTVIRRIEALEGRLGAALFERHPRGYVLTPRGERLLGSAEAIEAEAAKMAQDVASERPQLAGLVRISTLEGFGNFFLAERLSRFSQRYPNLLLELTVIQQIVSLSRREADLAITLSPPQAEGIEAERLTDYVLFVYGERDYLAARPPIQTREDLRDHRFSGYIDDLVFLRGLDYRHEIQAGLEAHLQSSSLHAQMQAASAGYGLCVLPAFVASRDPRLVPVLPEEIQLRRTYWMVSRPASSTGPRVEAFRGFIRDEIAAAEALFSGHA